MKLEHLGIWVRDLEAIRQFYETYFDANSNDKYVNVSKRFESYFLSFGNGARLELMRRPDIDRAKRDGARENSGKPEFLGYAHIAISVESESAVDALTSRIVADGYSCIDGPRKTGDGCYESVILDPEGNRVEITT